MPVRGTPLSLVWDRDGIGTLETGEAVEARRLISAPLLYASSIHFLSLYLRPTFALGERKSANSRHLPVNGAPSLAMTIGGPQFRQNSDGNSEKTDNLSARTNFLYAAWEIAM